MYTSLRAQRLGYICANTLRDGDSNTITMASLSEVEALAATCLIQTGLLNRKLEASKLLNGYTPRPDDEVRAIRLSLFESVQNLLFKVTPPEFSLTQGLSASVGSAPFCRIN